MDKINSSHPDLPASEDGKGQIREAAVLFILLAIPLLPALVTVCRLSYLAYNNSSDTFLYLDIARNFLKGRGLVLSFNIYQFWTGIFYPAIPFVHVGFSLFLSLLYLFFPSIEQLVLFNFVFAFLNSFLVYRIVKRLYGDKVSGAWIACIVAATVSMQITLLRLLTEQLSLFITLSAVYFFVSKKDFSKKGLFWLGLLLASGFFIRSSAIIYPAVFFLAFLLAKDGGYKKWRMAALIVFCPLFVVGIYELAVYAFFGVFSPQYPAAFKNYYLATFTHGGSFFPESPVIRPFEAGGPMLYYWANFLDMANVLFCELRIFIFFALFRIVKIFRSRRKDELLLAGLALVPAFATIFNYPYMRVADFQWTRFLIVPLVSMMILGVLEWRYLTERFLPKTKRLVFHSLLVIVFLSNFYQSSRVLEVYWKKEEAGEKVAALRSILEWTKANTGQEDLIAVSLYVVGRADLERPTVILPLYNTLNSNNLRDFLAIYRPRAVIFENTMPPALRHDLAALGYGPAHGRPDSELFTIYIPV
ncbi:MAG TPA: hypothetical protein DCL35_01205 [Candidatus Omnitrophica bacterium]|nr:hypothetical protein [Candidatus Omnitrophota bacterium]